MKEITVLSLFDGISCGYQTLKNLNIPVKNYYASEIDKNAIKIALKNHSDIIQLGDIRNWEEWDIEKPDLIIGGSSCQDLSIAGKQRGVISDTLEEYQKLKKENYEFQGQSYLFWEYLAILDYYKPQHFLLENVKMKKEFQTTMTNALKTVRDDVKLYAINSEDFSAQSRKRLYWTDLDVDMNYEKCLDTVEDILEEEVDDKYFIEPKREVIILNNEVKRKKIAYIGMDSQGYGVYKIHDKSITVCANSGGIGRNTGLYAVPHKRKLGYIGSDSQANRIYNIDNKSVTICGEAGGLGAKTGIYAMPCLTPDRLVKRQNGRRFKPPKSKFFTLTAQDKHGILIDNHIRKLTPVECERLQTLISFKKCAIIDLVTLTMEDTSWANHMQTSGESENNLVECVGDQLHKKLPFVGIVEQRDQNEFVQFVERSITIKDRKSTRLNSSHTDISRMPSSA